MKKFIKCFSIMILITTISLAQAPQTVQVTNPKGASCSTTSGTMVLIPKDTKLNVIDMKKVSLSADEDHGVTWWYYLVRYQRQEGWIKAEDTNIPYPTK